MGNSAARDYESAKVEEADIRSDPKKPGTVRVVCISDTHNLHDELTKPGSAIPLPEGDVLLCAGDISYYGTWHEVKAFVNWFAQQPHKHKIFIAGNHDMGLEDLVRGDFSGIGNKWKKTRLEPDDTQDPAEVRTRLLALLTEKTNIHWLQDSQITLEGITFWGSPWSSHIVLPWYAHIAAKLTVGPPGRMAMNLMDTEEQRHHWAHIPYNVDVVITHGPPHGFGDRNKLGAFCGDQILCEAIKNRRPRFHVFGHVHEAHGVFKYDHAEVAKTTTFINASICNLAHPYSATQAPIVFDVEPRGAGRANSVISTEVAYPGDWECPDCKNINWAKNVNCNRCGKSGKDQPRLGIKPGDWICGNCGDLVFASKNACFMCGTAKPEDTSPARLSGDNGRAAPY